MKVKISLESRIGITLVILLAGLYILGRVLNVPDPIPLTTESDITVIQYGDREISKGDTSKKQVIFTFDGGDSDESLEKVLQVLAKHRVKGTFFLTGKFIEAYPDMTRRIVKEGHEVFNHTYDHPYLTALSASAIRKEFEDMEALLMMYTGSSPRPFFRAPFGDRNDHVLKVALESGYQSVYWTVDAMDWKEDEGETKDKVLDRIMKSASPGVIYLMHLGDDITGEVLDEAFTKLKASGYGLVSLTQGLATK